MHICVVITNIIYCQLTMYWWSGRRHSPAHLPQAVLGPEREGHELGGPRAVVQRGGLAGQEALGPEHVRLVPQRARAVHEVHARPRHPSAAQQVGAHLGGREHHAGGRRAPCVRRGSGRAWVEGAKEGGRDRAYRGDGGGWGDKGRALQVGEDGERGGEGGGWIGGWIGGWSSEGMKEG